MNLKLLTTCLQHLKTFNYYPENLVVEVTHLVSVLAAECK